MHEYGNITYEEKSIDSLLLSFISKTNKKKIPLKETFKGSNNHIVYQYM